VDEGVAEATEPPKTLPRGTSLDRPPERDDRDDPVELLREGESAGEVVLAGRVLLSVSLDAQDELVVVEAFDRLIRVGLDPRVGDENTGDQIAVGVEEARRFPEAQPAVVDHERVSQRLDTCRLATAEELERGQQLEPAGERLRQVYDLAPRRTGRGSTAKTQFVPSANGAAPSAGRDDSAAVPPA
jgi:hypothetical protein